MFSYEHGSNIIPCVNLNVSRSYLKVEEKDLPEKNERRKPGQSILKPFKDKRYCCVDCHKVSIVLTIRHAVMAIFIAV